MSTVETWKSCLVPRRPQQRQRAYTVYCIHAYTVLCNIVMIFIAVLIRWVFMDTCWCPHLSCPFWSGSLPCTVVCGVMGVEACCCCKWTGPHWMLQTALYTCSSDLTPSDLDTWPSSTVCLQMIRDTLYTVQRSKSSILWLYSRVEGDRCQFRDCHRWPYLYHGWVSRLHSLLLHNMKHVMCHISLK